MPRVLLVRQPDGSWKVIRQKYFTLDDMYSEHIKAYELYAPILFEYEWYDGMKI